MAQFNLELCSCVVVLVVFLPLASGACADFDLGMGSGTIPDNNIIAYSEQSASTPARNSRLNYTSGSSWCARASDKNPYLQIDLQTLHIICAVSTQGNSQADQWVKNFTLQLSTDGTTWTDYKEGGQIKVFLGNSNQNGIVKNSLQEFASAKFIRFKPRAYSGFKVLRVEVYGILLTKVPSQPPAAFKLTASSSTSITASWQLPPVFARHGRKITGFKLFYKKKGSGESATTLTISNGSTLSRNVTWLDKYTEYEFKVLAFTSDGDGPKSAVEVERTKEDAPSQAPRNFDATAVTSTIITASWQLPPADSRNGVIIGFKLFYQKRGSAGRATTLTINNGTALRRDVTGLNVYTEYEFEVLAFTSVGDGPRSSPVVVVRTMKDGCVEFSLGMENGRIPDSGITASSSSPLAKNARLNYASESSWCAGTSDTNPYLQIDLQTLHIICAVSTQGNSQADRWVKSYTLQLSTDGTTWKDYKEAGQFKILTGNTDRNSEVKHVVYGILTRFLRFLPRTSQGGMCMRTEVFGVKKNPTCEMETIGLAFGGTIPDSSFSTSSHYDHRYKPSYGRLNRNSLGWAPKTKFDPADYLQIDFLYEYVICAVATQGANGINEWTKKYEIQLSVDGNTMVTYQENNADRVFLGNSNQNGIVKNSLQEFESAKFIRFKPTAYSGFKVLRVEVYGILLTKVPSQPPAAFKLTASSSTSITASWQLPPVFARHGRNITGFKLFYRKKGSVGSATTLTINSGSTLSRNVTGLDKYTEYEFQMLAFTSDGDGPKSAVEVERTKEDTPSQAPRSFSATAVTSTIITASWQLPPADSRNGIIIGFKLFYKKRGSAGLATTLTMNNGTVLSRDVAGLDIYTEYEFEVLAFTSVGDGPRSSPVVVVRTMKRDKPHLNDLPERTITAVGDLVVLTCDVSGDLEASVTWTKDGLTSIPRAQFKNSGKILIIQDVVLGDSGVYECKAMNLFGESRTSTVLIVAVPPRIMEELSPSKVICEKQTPCFLSCQASSYIPFNYSWTKDGQVPTSDNIKLMNNSIIVTPRDRQDYGEYVCHATNSLGSTEYTITLLSPKGIPRNIFLASVTALSCAVVVLLIIICGVIWQRRRAVPSERIQGKEKVDFHGVKSSPDRQSNDEQASDPNTYMELKARLPNHKQSHIPTEYQSLQEVPMNPEYYNMVLQKGIGWKQNEEVYEEI